MTRYGYARISTSHRQELSRQIKLLTDSGIAKENIFTDIESGKKTNRKGLNDLLSIAQEGDSITVCEFSRISRSTKQLIEIAEDLSNRGINFISLKEKIDTTTAEGKLFYCIISAFSAFEADLISERTKQGLAAAAAKGRKGGRPKVNQDELERAIHLYQNSNYSVSKISAKTNISKSSLYREINRLNIKRRDLE